MRQPPKHVLPHIISCKLFVSFCKFCIIIVPFGKLCNIFVPFGNFYNIFILCSKCSNIFILFGKLQDVSCIDIFNSQGLSVKIVIIFISIFLL